MAAVLVLKFAGELHKNLGVLFKGLNQVHITKDVYLEKLCLVSDRVGKDNISDFTNNLIHGFVKCREAEGRGLLKGNPSRLNRWRNPHGFPSPRGVLSVPFRRTHLNKSLLLSPTARRDRLRNVTWLPRPAGMCGRLGNEEADGS